MNPIEQILSGVLTALTGNLTLSAIIIVGIAIFFLIWRGVDFRYTAFLLAPSIAQLSTLGWFPVWVGGMVWFFVVGFGLYIAYRAIVPSY